MNVSLKIRCQRCGKRIRKGGLCYRLKAELISHFDGYIAQGKSVSMKDLIEKINAENTDLTEKQIEKQVYQKFEYIVCPVCRNDVENYLLVEGIN